MKASNLVIAFLGAPGSGKGTQAKLLQDKFGFACLATGDLLRERRKENDFTGRKVWQSMREGRLVSSLLVANLWSKEMEKIKKKKVFPGFIIDGSPRVMFEAKLIDEGLHWFEWEDKFKLVYLKISKKTSQKRLVASHGGRDRMDDVSKVIAQRWGSFSQKGKIVFDYYQRKGVSIVIDGERSIEEVNQSLIKKLGLDE